MDTEDLSDQNTGDCDEVLLLKKKLSETEEKLLKFKTFVLNLRNERKQLQDKVCNFLFVNYNLMKFFKSRLQKIIWRLKG